ncbi:hypothetical protein [Helicobacter sp.]|uniref:hypothetical protein n=1 Tax=Helicobacter sp. TaxID=218 RepID=UPI002A75BE53|nr:hypothetical protein [Helicobacter sp.]MDY2584165.1 hypothetical protein [Helicobacter sp.]
MQSWYHSAPSYTPNVELLKQSNLWNGLSQSVQDFFNRTNAAQRQRLENEHLGLLNQGRALYNANQGIKNQSDEINLGLLQNFGKDQAEAQLKAQNLRNAQKEHNLAIAKDYDAPLRNAELANIYAAIRHKQPLQNEALQNQAMQTSQQDFKQLQEALKLLQEMQKTHKGMQDEARLEKILLEMERKYPFASQKELLKLANDELRFNKHITPEEGNFTNLFSSEPVFDRVQSFEEALSPEEYAKLLETSPQYQLEQAMQNLLGGMLGSGIYGGAQTQTQQTQTQTQQKKLSKEEQATLNQMVKGL